MHLQRNSFLAITCLTALFSPPTLASAKIDLQWSICDTDAETVLRKLGEEGKTPYKAKPITYYDTYPPTYTTAGLSFRTKFKHHDPGYLISLIKARFGAETDNVPPEADCIWDQYGNASYYTCGLPSIVATADETVELWSPTQKAFAERYQHIDWDALVPYGPFMNPKWKLRILGHKGVFDDVVASPLHLMEIEISVKKRKGDKVHKKITKYLQDRGVVICEPQLPKTLRLFERLGHEDRWGMGKG
ncbi:MAG: hypothetical protein M1835_000631, partial [Candelina submexicana]